MAAWLGLTPREHATGGKQRLLGISKRGNKHLRTLLIHGARAVLPQLAEQPDALGAWLRGLRARPPGRGRRGAGQQIGPDRLGGHGR